MKALRQIVMLTQFAVSIATPLALSIFAGRWLTARFALGKWVMAVCILLGVGGAISGLSRCIRQMLPEHKKKEAPPISFNDHE